MGVMNDTIEALQSANVALQNDNVRLRSENENLRMLLAEDGEICAVQYRALVECNEEELTPDAIEVRKILLKDRTELEKAQAKIKELGTQNIEMAVALEDIRQALP